MTFIGELAIAFAIPEAQTFSAEYAGCGSHRLALKIGTDGYEWPKFREALMAEVARVDAEVEVFKENRP